MVRRRNACALALAAVALCARSAAAGRGAIRDRDGKRLAPSHVVTGVDHALDGELGAGEDVVLTIDRDVQKLAEKAVRGHTAAAVAVVEVETGRLLALVSSPSGDAVDRTLAKTYRPASTFKLVTAVAALENGLASTDEEMTCTGTRQVGDHVLRDMEVHGTIDLLAALERSCNVYFWALGERAGIDRLAQVARDFGFGARTGVGIDGELAGQVPDQRLYNGDANHNLELTLNTAVGLGDVQVTVLQLAMAYAALANGGRLYVPQVVRRIQRPGAEVVAERHPVLRRHIAASPATLTILRRGMTRAVNARGGTAFTARRGAVKMGGKTGTFEPPDRDEADALFAGWAPSEHPEIAVVVLIERGGVGGAVAAPVARDIIDGYFTRVHPPPHKARAHRDKKKSEKTAQKTATKKTEKKKDAHRKARAHQDRKRPRR